MDSRLCIETRVRTAAPCLAGSSFVQSSIAVSVHLYHYAVEQGPENSRKLQLYGLQRRGECRTELNPDLAQGFFSSSGSISFLRSVSGLTAYTCTKTAKHKQFRRRVVAAVVFSDATAIQCELQQFHAPN